MNSLKLLAVGAAATLLAGCISVLPKAAPVQLYSFGGGMAPAAAPAAGPRFMVQPLAVNFDRPAAGDRILTMTGNQAAYIKGARWDSGAELLFESALTNAFAADGGRARLIARGEPVRPDDFLKIEVRTFEARYVRGQGAAPTIVVTVYASLSHPMDRTLTADHLFTTSVPASDDRVGAITTAFDQAVNQTLGDLAKWVDARGSG